MNENFTGDPSKEFSVSDVIEHQKFEQDLRFRKQKQDLEETLSEIKKRSLETEKKSHPRNCRPYLGRRSNT